ncbi:MAG: peptidoglycan-binding domain-containing protein [Actinomycetota bacterium]
MRAPTADETAVFTMPRTRRWPAALLGLAVGVGGTLATAPLLDDDDQAAALDQVEVDLATAPIEVRDLIEEVEWIGDLAYGDPVDVAAPAEGTVTATVAAGDIVRRGDTVVEIDREPVVLFYGAVPSWRDLAEGDEGPDVLQLETNLVALGYDPDGLVTVDEDYTARTEDMVERWQEDLGRATTGEVARGDVIVADGPVSVTTAPRVGDPARSGEVLGSVSARSIVTDVVAPQPGAVERVIDEGAVVEHGTVLYVAGGVEVVALTRFSVPDERDDGPEQVFILVDEGRQVGSVDIAVDDMIGESAPVMTLETQTLSVVVPVELDAADEWAAGQAVTVTLPDDTDVDGVVVEVGTVAQGGGQGQAPTIDVVVELTALVDDDLPASEVTVTVAGDSVFGAVVAPSRALVTLAEGGFALEKVQADGTTVLVAVETGAFDDGVVEIESSQLVPGDEVVVPR